MSERPEWAEGIRRKYVRGESSLFFLHDNIFDQLPHAGRLYDLTDYLSEVLLKDNKQTIVVYDPSSRVRVIKRAADAVAIERAIGKRAPSEVLPALEELLLTSHSTALVIEYADMLAPSGEMNFLSEQDRVNIVTLHRWSLDPRLTKHDNVIFMLAEQTASVHPMLISNPGVASVAVPLPDHATRVTVCRLADATLDPRQAEELATHTAGLKAVHLFNLLTPEPASLPDEAQREALIRSLLGSAATPVADLQNFKHLERPKDWNIPSLKALFELMDLSPGQAVMVTQNSAEAVQQLHKVINERVEKLVRANQQLASGIPFWGQTLLSDPEVEKISAQLVKAKEFLESLQAYNTPGKLKNFKYDADDIKGYQATFARLKEVEQLQAYCGELAQFTQYLSAAEAILPETHPWVAESKQKRTELLNEIRKPAQRESETFKADALKQLKKLKAGYIKVYLGLYAKARLNLTQDKEKKDLLQDYRLKHLRRLATVNSINSVQLTEFDNQIGKLRTGTVLTEKDLENDPKSPDGFWPGMEDTSVSSEARLASLKSDLEKIHKSWTKNLLKDLDDPVIQGNFELLKAPQKKLLKGFMAAKELPDEISQEFLTAIQQALSGLTKLPVRLDDLKKALFPDGSPATPAEFKERFMAYLEQILKGRDAAKVRLVIE